MAASIDGRLFIRRGFNSRGEVRFVSAKIGLLDAQSSVLTNPSAVALRLSNSTIGGGLTLTMAVIKGEVNITGIAIEGSLYGNGMNIAETSASASMRCDFARATGSLWLQNGVLSGSIDLRNVRISGNLLLDETIITNTKGIAIQMDGSNIDGHCTLRNGFQCDGTVRLYGARIGGDLDFARSRISRIEIVFSTVTGGILLRNIATTLDWLSLVGTSVGVLRDDTISWPRLIYLHGFTYGSINSAAPRTGEERVAWLGLQSEFHSQPYEQMITALRSMGHYEDAAQVAIAKQRMIRRSVLKRPLDILINYFLDFVVGFGYRPIRPILCLIVLLLVGTLVFGYAERRGLICPSSYATMSAKLRSGTCAKPPQYPNFQPLVYSLELLIPVRTFEQRVLENYGRNVRQQCS